MTDPYYHDRHFTLYHADTLDILPLTDVDLTVTSPPYNIGKTYDEPRTLNAYLDWTKHWTDLIHQSTRRTGSFWLNVGYTPLHPAAKAVPLAYLLWDHTHFHLVQEVIWHYGAGLAAKKFYSPRHETWLWYAKDKNYWTYNLDAVREPAKYPHQFARGRSKTNPLGKNPGDVWTIPKVTSGAGRSSPERTPHPAQFPEAVIERIIRASSDPGDLILDPFMGSGTVAKVATRLHRNCIGIEKNEEYCELAVRRYQT